MEQGKAMNSNVINILFLLVGIIFGVIMGINVNYPFEIKKLDEIKSICPNQQIKSIKINVAGKVKSVECENSTVFNLN